MSGRTGLRKSTSLLKEGTMAGEQRRDLNATTQSFATIPPRVRHLVKGYCMYIFSGLYIAPFFQWSQIIQCCLLTGVCLPLKSRNPFSQPCCVGMKWCSAYPGNSLPHTAPDKVFKFKACVFCGQFSQWSQEGNGFDLSRKWYSVFFRSSEPWLW